jgi:hypothetical protein
MIAPQRLTDTEYDMQSRRSLSRQEAILSDTDRTELKRTLFTVCAENI